MLAGMQDAVGSLFPSLRDITPSEDELKAGADKLKFGRTVKISGYKTEVFDMLSSKGRSAYDKRMMDLSQRAQIGTVRILQHDRQILSKGDGSTGWFAYLEWMEYELKEDSND